MTHVRAYYCDACHGTFCWDASEKPSRCLCCGLASRRPRAPEAAKRWDDMRDAVIGARRLRETEEQDYRERIARLLDGTPT